MIKAIETEYKGYRFRSRLEARWAVFFDALGVEWEYEKQGFEFDDGTRYLPDFWISHLKLWVEIKGALSKPDPPYYTSPELRLLEKFRDSQEWPVACIVGDLGKETIHFFASDLTDSSGGSYHFDLGFWCFSNGIITISLDSRKDRSFHSDNLAGEIMPQFTYARDFGFDVGLIRLAVEYARGARFEHGEKPNVPPPEQLRQRRKEELLLQASMFFKEAEAALGVFDIDRSVWWSNSAKAALQLAKQF